MPVRWLVCGVLVTALVGLSAAQATPPPEQPPKPPPIGELPKGKRTTCTMKGPEWVLYGVHNPDGPPLRGTRYAVTAWGITCPTARRLLRAFFPKMPAHP